MSQDGQVATVRKDGDLFSVVEGAFYRLVDPAYRGLAMAGSMRAGRYSRAEQATLYLSASPEGADAAMVTHRSNRAPDLEFVRIDVAARRVVDLRDAVVCELAGIALEDAMAPWTVKVANGEVPPSWSVRDRLEALGATGLIDPSRQVAGLWHLVLFRWNVPGAPRAVLAGASKA